MMATPRQPTTAKMPRALVTCATLLASAMVFGALHCGGDETGDQASNADSGVSALDAKPERAPSEPWEADPPVPVDGWIPYNDYDPICGFWVSVEPAKLPPITWQPCRVNDQTSTKSCREMVTDWPPQAFNSELITPGTEVARRSDGRLVMSTARYQPDWTLRMVAELDGNVLVGLRERAIGPCILGDTKSDGDHYAFKVYDAEATGRPSSYGGGAIGGHLDDPHPKVLKHYHDKLARGFAAGEPGLLELPSFTLSSWTDGGVIKSIPTGDVEGSLAQNWPFFFGSTLFWAADSSAVNKQKVYTDAAGTKDFLTFGADPTRGVADLGTDGQSLVWIEGSERPSTSAPFPKVLIATSPFTTDPAQIQRRVLRTDLRGSPFGTSPFVVGCGYAARQTTTIQDGSPHNAVVIARLVDGYAWFLPTDGKAWGWLRPLAITCDEIILMVSIWPAGDDRPHVSVARVRLDSLGPPTPP